MTYTNDDNLKDQLGDHGSPNSEDGWIDREPTPGVTEAKPDGQGARYQEESKEEVEDDDFMNPMAIKLRKMRLELRGKLDAAPSVSNEVGNLKNEDMQGYDTYKSPLARQKLEFGLKNTKPQQSLNTESSEPNFKF